MPRARLYRFARQTVPCVGFNTRRVTRLVTQYYDKALAPAQLRSTQYSLLGALALADEMPLQELAYVLAMDRTTLTRNLNPLIKRGLIKVAENDDHRARPLQITTKGKSALANALPLWEKAQARIVDNLGEAKWDQIMRGLHQISMIVEDGLA
jgi:DNA-binding MarR family transcriptional regulator